MNSDDVFLSFFQQFKKTLKLKHKTNQNFIKTYLDLEPNNNNFPLNIFQDFEEIILQKSAIASYIATICRITKKKTFLLEPELDLKNFSTARIKNLSFSEKVQMAHNIDTQYIVLHDIFLQTVKSFIKNVYSNLSSSKKRKLNLEDKRLKQNLPIYSIKNELINFIDSKSKENSNKNKFLVVIGEAGSGKSTQIAQYLLESEFASSLEESEKRILVTQPRKIAVNSVSKRIAEELAVDIGSLVGFHYGKTDKTTEKTIIDFTTNFQLYNEIIEDRKLSRYSCIILDEAHERSTEADLIISLLRDIASESNIKVIITSATMNEKLFTEFFFNCSSLIVPGRTFPVKIQYSKLNNVLDIGDEIIEIVKNCLIKKKEQEFQGHILIFLPTISQILSMKSILKLNIKSENIEILQLHSKITNEESSKLFEPSSSKIKRLILSTNIAEASVTINNISVVIDSGLENEVNFDPQSYSKSFSIGECPKSSCRQRMGRAGRTCPGICYRLYSEENFSKREEFKKPEILRSDLCLAILKILNLKLDPLTFDFIEKPKNNSIKEALDRMIMLEAIKRKKDNYRIRTLGKMMIKFDLHPMLSKIFLDDLESDYLNELCIIAAMSHCAMSIFRIDPEILEQGKNNIKKVQLACENGDLISYLHIYNEFTSIGNKKEWCKGKGISLKNMESVVSILNEMHSSLLQFLSKEMKHKIKNYKQEKKEINDNVTKTLLQAISKGLFLNILVKTDENSEKMGYIALKTKENVFIHPSSVCVGQNNTPKYLVASGIHSTSKVFATGVSVIKKKWILKILEEIPEDVRPFKANDLQRYQIKLLKINSIPDAVFRKLNARNLLDEIKKKFQFKDNIDYYLKEISILTNEKNERVKIENLIREEIEKIRKNELNKKSRELEYEGVTRVILRDGGYIDEFIFRGQYKTITFKNLPIYMNAILLAEQLTPFCVPELLNSLSKPESNIEIIKFENEENGNPSYTLGIWTLSQIIDQECFNKIKEAEVTLREINFNINITISGVNSLRLIFESISLTATLYYSKYSGSGKVIFHRSYPSPMDVCKLNYYLHVEGVISKKNPLQFNYRNSPIIFNLIPGKISEVSKNLSKMLLIMETDFTFIAYNTEVLDRSFYQPPHVTQSIMISIFQKYESLKNNLKVILAELPGQITKPTSKRFYLNFSSSNSAKKAYQNENMKVYRELCPNGINLKISFMMYFMIENDKYDALTKELFNLKNKSTPEIEFKKNDYFCKISVKSENQEDILDCMNKLKKIVKEGTIYSQKRLGIWNEESIKTFLFKNRKTLKDLIERKNKVYIDFNNRITLFGSPQNIEQSIVDIDTFILTCKKEKFILKSIDVVALMKCSEFQELQMLEDVVIIFDQIKKELDVISSNFNYFQQIKILISKPEFEILNSTDFFCSKCFTQLKNKYVLLCGHGSCKSCLVEHIESFLIKKGSFPILTPCCSIAMPIVDLMELVPANLKPQLIKQSTEFYLICLPNEFFKCPSKECNQIFSVKMLESIDYCDVCFRKIKKSDFPTENIINNKNIMIFHEETKTEIFKKCNVCNTIWEKDGGSDHMMCLKCDSHFCYRCELVFIKRKKNLNEKENEIILKHLSQCANKNF